MKHRLYLIALIISLFLSSCKILNHKKRDSICEEIETLFYKRKDKNKITFTRQFLKSENNNPLCLSFQIAYYESKTGINASCEKGGG